MVGEVSLDHEPVANAKLVFIPRTVQDGQQNVLPMAFGQTDEQGKFVLTLADGTREITPGDYRVIISQRESNQTPRPGMLDLKTRFPGLVPESLNGKSIADTSSDKIPPQFNRNSELQVKIEAELSINTVRLDLKSIDVAPRQTSGNVN